MDQKLKAEFLSEEYWLRKALKKAGLTKETTESDLSFRKRCFQKVWDLSGDLMEATEFLFGPYKMTDDWDDMEQYKTAAMQLMIRVRKNEGNSEAISAILDMLIPKDPLED